VKRDVPAVESKVGGGGGAGILAAGMGSRGGIGGGGSWATGSLTGGWLALNTGAGGGMSNAVADGGAKIKSITSLQKSR
jgi:hypothetical protein